MDEIELMFLNNLSMKPKFQSLFRSTCNSCLFCFVFSRCLLDPVLGFIKKEREQKVGGWLADIFGLEVKALPNGQYVYY